MQWIPAYVGITENEMADALAKKARQININKVTHATLSGINSVAKAKLNRKIKIRHQIPEITTNRTLTSTLTKTQDKTIQGYQDSLRWDKDVLSPQKLPRHGTNPQTSFQLSRFSGVIAANK